MLHTLQATLVILTLVSSFTIASSGRIYRIVRPPSYYDSWRQKRQSHPLATQVRLPEVAFADTVSLTNSPADDGGESGEGGGGLRQGELAQPLSGLADYLTPPPPAAGPQAPPLRQDTKWELGFDANEILVPPSEQTRYDTLKLFTLVPSSAASQEADPGFDTAIQSILEQTDSSTAGSNSQEFQVDLSGERPGHHFQQQQQQQHRDHQGPVYTYVKTDRHGHFKWGVRHGQ